MNKTILITGAGKGIGYECAHFLKKKGYEVFPCSRSKDDIEKLKQEGFEAHEMDVSQPSSIQKVLPLILEKTKGQLYALFNNAGFAQPGAIEDLSFQDLQNQFNTNVFGAFELVHRVIPVMRQQGFGRIINTSSILGEVTLPFRGAYCASKFAMESLSDALRQEIKSTNISVSIILPGPVVSNFRTTATHTFQTVLKEKPSQFSSIYKKMEDYFQYNDPSSYLSDKPSVIFKSLWHALESPSPRKRYYPGFVSKALHLTNAFFPDFILDHLIGFITHQEQK